MKRCAAALTVFACTALSGVWAFSQASFPSKPAQKARPSFQAAGPRSATAPSGYSDGVTQQRAQATGKLIPLLQRQVLLQLLPRESAPGCAQQEALRSAAVRTPRDLSANLNLGWFDLWHGQPAQALAPLRAAARIAPADVRPKIALTIAYIDTKDETQAQQTLDALQAMHANEIVTAQLSAALPSETETTAGTPMSAEVAYTKGLAMLSSGDATQAQRIFAAGLALPAVKPGARADLSLGMGLADALRGTPQQAAAELLDASESDPHNLVSSTLLAAWIAPDAPSAPQALVVIKQTAQLLPTSAIARYNLATLMARMTRQGRSMEQAAAIKNAYDQALAIDPRLAAAHFGLGELDQDMGHTTQAVAQMRQAIQLKPGVASWHYRLFRELEVAGMRADAAKEIAMFQSMQRNAGAVPGEATLLQGIPTESLEPGNAPCGSNQRERASSSGRL